MNQHFICMIYPVAVNGCGGENIFSDLWQLSSACVSANEQQSPPTNSLRDGRGERKKEELAPRSNTHTSSHSNPNHGYANGGATSNRLQRSKHTVSAQKNVLFLLNPNKTSQKLRIRWEPDRWMRRYTPFAFARPRDKQNLFSRYNVATAADCCATRGHVCSWNALRTLCENRSRCCLLPKADYSLFEDVIWTRKKNINQRSRTLII